jgi:hypothetical protein
MNMQSPVTVASLKAPINFLRPTGERPVAYQCEPPPGVPVRTGEFAPHLVSIRNARPIAANLSLDHEGFALAYAPSDFDDFGDEEAIRLHYYAEVEEVLKAATGAALVIGFDHNIRNAARAALGEPGIGEPVSRAHNDFTARSGPERISRELAAQGLPAGLLDFSRYAIINLWRPIGNPVEKWPLALCDASTLASSDLVASDLVYRDRVGETYSLTHNSAQRWYYFPRLSPHEAILIKCYDSAEENATRFTAHTAFHDPTARFGAPERESIETRAIVIYPA